MVLFGVALCRDVGEGVIDTLETTAIVYAWMSRLLPFHRNLSLSWLIKSKRRRTPFDFV